MTVNSVDKPSKAWLEAKPRLQLVHALYDGTEEMRKAGVTYLPKEEKESDESYANRLNISTLFPAYRRTVDTFVAMPLQRKIVVSEKTPPDIAGWLENVDLTGRDLDSFARSVFKAAVNDGMTHILVDYPEAPKAANGQETLADERAAKRRPYAVHVDTCNIIGYKSQLVGGKQTLTQVRISERTEEPDPVDEFATVEVQRVRVLEQGRVRLYKKVDAGWTLESDNKITMKEIPLITIYTNREGFMQASPPLVDLAYMNVAHWQSTSDQRTILHVARVPILHIATAQSEEVGGITIGASRAITTDRETVIKFVEHTGAAIAAGQADLDTLKDEMSNFGLELLVSPGRVTATERQIDKSQNDSAIAVMSRALQSGLEEMVRLMAQWVNKPIPEDMGTIDLQTDFKFEVNTDEVNVLWNMRMNGDLSQESFWHEMARRGVLSDSFDPEAEQSKLADALPPVRPGTDPNDPDAEVPGDEEDVTDEGDEEPVA